MSQLLEARRSLRRKVNSNKKLDRLLHLLITGMLLANIVLILYAMFAITFRMTLGGVAIVDTLPIALYIFPLLILLPLMLRSYYKERTAAWNFVFLIITSVFFGLLSTLVRGFVICLVFNLVAIVAIFIVGRFRPKQSIRKVGKKGLAYFVLLNLIGFMFPVTVVLMGQTPIASITPSVIPQISLTVPLSDFEPEKYIGGVGLNSRIFWELDCPEVHSFNPDNPRLYISNLQFIYTQAYRLHFRYS